MLGDADEPFPYMPGNDFDSLLSLKFDTPS